MAPLSNRSRPTDASDIMTARVVAVKPGTTVPEVGRGDETPQWPKTWRMRA